MGRIPRLSAHCASLLFARGRNAKQVQRWRGHHAASCTLDTYAHLLDDGVGEALDLGAELDGLDDALVSEPAVDSGEPLVSPVRVG